MNRIKRKKRFIDRKVQGALLVQVIRHWLVFLFGAFVLLSVVQVLFGEPNRSLIDHLGTVWSHHVLFFVVVLMLVPVFVNDIIKLSHRFVGPVMRVRGELRRIAAGEAVAPIELRKNDFWQGLANDFNSALAKIDRDKTTAGGIRSHDDDEAAAAAANRQVELVELP